MTFLRYPIHALLALALSTALSVPSSAQGPSEHQVKAAFLYNFANFVEWPRSTLADTSSIVIGILGEDPFGQAFAPFKDRTIKGRSLRIIHSKLLQELPFCHILFISSSEEKNLAQIFQYLGDRPVLTVGESAGFAQRGGTINFVMKNKKVRFEINQQRAAKTDLKISSKLLKLASIVEDAPEHTD